MKQLSGLLCLLGMVLWAVLPGCETSGRQYDTMQMLEEDVQWLASDERGGRLAGTADEAAAAAYIADRFRLLGLYAAGDDDTYKQHFLLTGPMAGAMGVNNHISRNVAGFVEGSSTPDEYIVVGAHYDGQGHGGIISMNHETQSSLHNSADDNASGTAGLLHLARVFMEQPAERTIVFVAFSGEELGLIGSRYFVEQMQMEPESVIGMFNFDMIGRLRDGNLTITGTGSSPGWEELFAGIDDGGLQITLSESDMGASDHAAFLEAGIPAVHYFTGVHDDYHRESDTPDKINIEGMADLLGHAEQAIRRLAAAGSDEFTFREREPRESGGMPSGGVSLGVTPDYNYPGPGFRIGSVRGDGPAAAGGLQDGDVILQMGEYEISDIFEYMDRLGEFTPGESVPLRVERDEEILELTITF
jgi:hypothetical protein